MELKRIKELIAQDKMIKFYQCAAWYGKKGIRNKALQRDNYECQSCKRKGKVKKAEQVHHIKEVKKYPELALVLENTESLCLDCHNEEHERFSENNQPKFINEERW